MSTVAEHKQATRRFVVPGVGVTVEALTATEKQALAEAEKIITHHFDTYRAAGEALLDIRERRLYREGYATFEAYCRLKWSMSKTQANRLISASQTVKELEKVSARVAEVTKQLTETAVRPLTKLAPKVRRKVIERVAKRMPPGAPKAGGIPAKVVLDMAREVAPEAFHRGGAPPNGGGGGDGKKGKKDKTALIDRQAAIGAIDKWQKAKARSGELDNMSPLEAVRAVRKLIAEL